MRPLTRFFIYSIALFLVIIIAMKPYNWFCQVSTKCQKVYVSDLFPSFEGNNDIDIVLEIKNYNADLDFLIMGYDTISTVSGRKNVVKYQIKNLTDNTINFRPKFYIEPKKLAKYVNLTDCLCFEKYSIDGGKELNLQASFKIDSDIDELFLEEEALDITIGYILN